MSTETAILAIDSALRIRVKQCDSNAPLVGAELLCRNAPRLDACQSLHWPSYVDGMWNADFSPRTKLLLVDALVQMTLTTGPSENALRSIAVRLYGIWLAEGRDSNVRGCIGTLLSAIIDPLRALCNEEFIQGNQHVSFEDLKTAAASAHENPDGFLARVAKDRAEHLCDRASQCYDLRLDSGSLAHGCVGVTPAGRVTG